MKQKTNNFLQVINIAALSFVEIRELPESWLLFFLKQANFHSYVKTSLLKIHNLKIRI